MSNKRYFKKGAHGFQEAADAWDRGSAKIRNQILEDFLEISRTSTAFELEKMLGNNASLLLARIVTWLRTTTQGRASLRQQIEAASVFVRASGYGGSRFLDEFKESGGISIAMDLLSSDAREIEKARGIELLVLICKAGGREYRELICESGGLARLCACLADARLKQTQEAAKSLLYELATANPKYTTQVYKMMLSQLAESQAVVAQITAAQALCELLPEYNSPVHASVLAPIMAMLKQTDLQNEAYELLRVLMRRDNLVASISVSLIELLDGSDPETTLNMMQIQALGLLKELAASRNVATDIIALGGHMSCLTVIGSTKSEQTRQLAADLLEYMGTIDPTIIGTIRDAIGDEISQSIQDRPRDFYDGLTSEQLNLMRKKAQRYRHGVRIRALRDEEITDAVEETKTEPKLVVPTTIKHQVKILQKHVSNSQLYEPYGVVMPRTRLTVANEEPLLSGLAFNGAETETRQNEKARYQVNTANLKELQLLKTREARDEITKMQS